MSRADGDTVLVLLEQSLIAWRVIGRVRRGDDGVITITGLGRAIIVARAEPGHPFRWLVTVDGRRRPAVSLVAVLRQVRGALDPGHAATRVRFGAAPVEPP